MVKSWIWILGLGIAAAGFSGCTRLEAGNKENKEWMGWMNDMLTPRETVLEKATGGFSIKGVLKNMPNRLVVLMELHPTEMILIDSFRTDGSGNFTLDGNLTEDVICVMQWSNSAQILLVLNNSTKMELEITGDGSEISYKMTGKGIDGTADIKELMDLNNFYSLKLSNIETEFNKLTGSPQDAIRAQELSASYMALRAERNAAIRELVMSKKKSLIPYLVVTFGMIEEFDLAFLDHAHEVLKSYGEESKYFKNFLPFYTAEKALAVGSVAPEIVQKTPEGGSLALSSLRGKVVLIDFWASWCGPCRKENPNVRRMYAKFKDKGFEIYGVSLDYSQEKWKAAIAADTLTWKHVSDLKHWENQAAKLYKVSGIPQTYLLDKEGKIVAKGLRGPALEAKLEELLVRP